MQNFLPNYPPYHNSYHSRMPYAVVKMLQRDRINTHELESAFSASLRRRDGERTFRYNSQTEENIEKINKLMYAEDIFNTRMYHRENNDILIEIFEVFLGTPGIITIKHN